MREEGGHMHYPHIWTRIYGTPLMIHPDKAVVIEAVLRSKFMGEHIERPAPDARGPRPGAFAYRGVDKPYAMSEAGVAVIPVVGTLVQRGSFMDAMSGITSYGRIGRLLDEAVADADVAGIVLEIDSYGGEVHGVFDLAKNIVTARGVKPVWTAINEEAYSAGYAIAAAAERVFVPESGALGSIGVIAMHVDQSKRDSTQGYSYTPIFAGKWKNDFSSHEPLSDHARTAAQQEVDRYYGLFVSGVAEMRGIDEKTVRATEAGVFSPKAAIDIGLADEMATINEVVMMMEDRIKPKSAFLTGTRQASHSMSKETSMEGNNQGAAATLTAEQQQAHQQAIEAARRDGEQAGRDAGIKAERERIAAILGSEEAKGRTVLARHIANETNMDAEAAKKMLAASPVEQALEGSLLGAAMSHVPNPAVGAAGGTGSADDEVDAAARRIAGYASGAPATRQ